MEVVEGWESEELLEPMHGMLFQLEAGVVENFEGNLEWSWVLLIVSLRGGDMFASLLLL